MKHLKKGRKLHRERGQRQALLKSLASSLILKNKIKTTLAKAKEVRPFAEKLVSVSKKNNFGHNAFKEAEKFLPKSIAKKLVKDIAPKYKERKGGYTRITKLLPRKTDSAKMAFIEFI
ncbi:50S ribosomal protein L17 [Candidatus Giovannonibacteria bacterium]|nr:50S ribosomal protein L17 [Candidatus Giovannonibacteria bacterium]